MNGNPSAGIPRHSVIAAIILTGVYLAFSWWLLDRFAVPDRPAGNWERALIIYNGIAAVGFTAIGVLLGTQVQQANVVNARHDAADAKAKEEKTKAAVRQALKNASMGTPSDGVSIDTAGQINTLRNELLDAL